MMESHRRKNILLNHLLSFTRLMFVVTIGFGHGSASEREASVDHHGWSHVILDTTEEKGRDSISKIQQISSLSPSQELNGPEPALEVKQARKNSAVIEAKVGYFFFQNSKMSKIYNKGGVDYGLSASIPFWKQLNFYASVSYFERVGKSLNVGQNTSIWQIPIDVGIQPVIPISDHFRYYFSAGPTYFYLHQHNNSSSVPRNKARNGIGMFVNTGFRYIALKHLVIDLFGEYSYRQTTYPSQPDNVYVVPCQVGGFSFGGGIGYSF